MTGVCGVAMVTGALLTTFGCSTPAPETSSASFALHEPTRIEAESFIAQNAVEDQQVTTFQVGISNVDHGDWVNYGRINFGDEGHARTFTMRYATPNSGNRVVVRLDSPDGPELVNLLTSANGPGWNTYTEQSATTSPVTGPHDLYVFFDGSANRAAQQNQ